MRDTGGLSSNPSILYCCNPLILSFHFQLEFVGSTKRRIRCNESGRSVVIHANGGYHSAPSRLLMPLLVIIERLMALIAQRTSLCTTHGPRTKVNHTFAYTNKGRLNRRAAVEKMRCPQHVSGREAILKAGTVLRDEPFESVIGQRRPKHTL